MDLVRPATVTLAVVVDGAVRVIVPDAVRLAYFIMPAMVSVEAEKLVVHNPMGYPPRVNPKPLAPRLDALDDKTIFLVDCRFDDADLLLKQLQDWFSENSYADERRDNPTGPESGTLKVVRGGSWVSSGKFCRAAQRDPAVDDARDLRRPGPRGADDRRGDRRVRRQDGTGERRWRRPRRLSAR